MHAKTSSGFDAEPLADPYGEQEGEHEDDQCSDVGVIHEPEIDMNPPGQDANVIHLGADAEGAELRAFEQGNVAGDFAGILLIEQGIEEGIKGVGILEMDGNDASIVAVGGLDGFNDRVRRAAGGEVAAGDVVGRVKLAP